MEPDNPLSHRFASGGEPPTEQMENNQPSRPQRIPEPAIEVHQDPETELFIDDGASGTTDHITNPVTGWLVIIDGPGRGAHLKVGLGVNTVGRLKDQRISVDYGDQGISRGNHCLITFDPKTNRFYIQHGEGQNLTYLEGEPVLAPTELPAFSKIQLSETHFMFVPFCGDQFSWTRN